MIRECIICGAAFEPGRYNQKVCGDACRRKYKSRAVMASREKNREPSRAAAKRFRERHPEKVAAYQAAYYRDVLAPKRREETT